MYCHIVYHLHNLAAPTFLRLAVSLSLLCIVASCFYANTEYKSLKVGENGDNTGMMDFFDNKLLISTYENQKQYALLSDFLTTQLHAKQRKMSEGKEQDVEGLVPRLISSVRNFGNLTLEIEDALRQPWLKVLCS